MRVGDRYCKVRWACDGRAAARGQRRSASERTLAGLADSRFSHSTSRSAADERQKSPHHVCLAKPLLPPQLSRSQAVDPPPGAFSLPQVPAHLLRAFDPQHSSRAPVPALLTPRASPTQRTHPPLRAPTSPALSHRDEITLNPLIRPPASCTMSSPMVLAFTTFLEQSGS